MTLLFSLSQKSYTMIIYGNMIEEILEERIFQDSINKIRRYHMIGKRKGEDRIDNQL